MKVVRDAEGNVIQTVERYHYPVNWGRVIAWGVALLLVGTVISMIVGAVLRS
jgi:hypothetical protein